MHESVVGPKPDLAARFGGTAIGSVRWRLTHPHFPPGTEQAKDDYDTDDNAEKFVVGHGSILPK